MNKIKDFFYNCSDIVIVFLVVAVAGFVIYGRIDSIMAYPQSLTASANTFDEDAVSSSDEDVNTDIDSKSAGDASKEPSLDEALDIPVISGDTNNAMFNGEEAPPTAPDAGSTANKQNNANTDSFKVTIPQGSFGASIAQILKDEGLIAQSSDFINAVQTLGAESKLKAGTFYIPKGSTPEQIVKIMTNIK